MAFNILNFGGDPSSLTIHLFVSFQRKRIILWQVNSGQYLSVMSFSNLCLKSLKLILPNIIDDSQSAFVLRRLITDNVLVAFDIFHYMRNKWLSIKVLWD